MKVDVSELRAVADRLRDQVQDQIAVAAGRIARAGADVAIDTTFDDYATPGPYREVAASWQAELRVAQEAVAQLAGALAQAADDYEEADLGAEDRIDQAHKRPEEGRTRPGEGRGPR
ncbi:hypothetical protein [Actinoplanes sp. NPDC051494]|uniref:hypothetical protein n=1 Tax=Actinoplanes sp. NPDC051494 TaxID=3363907 RepID=UPI00378FB09B